MTAGLSYMLAEAGSENSVSFPKLGIKINIQESFQVFGLTVRWYGVIICCGMILCMILGLRFCRRYNLDSDKVLDYVLFAIPAAIVGARLYYVLFRLDYYKEHPGEIVMIWRGGLAIYGGIIAAAITIFIVSRVKKDRFLHILDFAMPYIMLGQAIGRWGNFVNQEAYGSETSWVLGMTGTRIEQEVGSGVLVHPTFLYESVWCLIGFAVLVIFRKRFQKAYGEVTALYMCLYGAERAIVESLRTDSLMITLGKTDLRVSQILSIVLVFVGIALLIDSRRRGVPVVFTGKEAAGDGEDGENAGSSLSGTIELLEEEGEEQSAEDAAENEAAGEPADGEPADDDPEADKTAAGGNAEDAESPTGGNAEAAEGAPDSASEKAAAGTGEAKKTGKKRIVKIRSYFCL